MVAVYKEIEYTSSIWEKISESGVFDEYDILLNSIHLSILANEKE